MIVFNYSIVLRNLNKSINMNTLKFTGSRNAVFDLEIKSVNYILANLA